MASAKAGVAYDINVNNNSGGDGIIASAQQHLNGVMARNNLNKRMAKI